MEIIPSLEMSVHIRTTRRYIQEDGSFHFHNDRCENLKSYIRSPYYLLQLSEYWSKCAYAVSLSMTSTGEVNFSRLFSHLLPLPYHLLPLFLFHNFILLHIFSSFYHLFLVLLFFLHLLTGFILFNFSFTSLNFLLRSFYVMPLLTLYLVHHPPLLYPLFLSLTLSYSS
jgi:hypothetical protein